MFKSDGSEFQHDIEELIGETNFEHPIVLSIVAFRVYLFIRIYIQYIFNI